MAVRLRSARGYFFGMDLMGMAFGNALGLGESIRRCIPLEMFLPLPLWLGGWVFANPKNYHL